MDVLYLCLGTAWVYVRSMYGDEPPVNSSVGVAASLLINVNTDWYTYCAGLCVVTLLYGRSFCTIYC